MTDKELILEYVKLDEWNDSQKIVYLSTAVVFQTDRINIKYDKYGYRIDPSIVTVNTTLKEMLKDKDLINTLRS